ncbi:C40 family peptidase [Clostridium sp. ZS2-4]|uniref:C40 family peptidase n=1 Tax=Clostridium sp. ZS2-4 TaxID=2987703 RepID=UPI00227BD31E|nr:C40 family peptidase [Clostridium sp. ZS2-4]MCY6354774.1 NlpC/P60 family protein [Clostridium sp. ZS2-4]
MNKKLTTLVTTVVLVASMSTTAVLAEPLSNKLNNQKQQLQQHKNEYNSAQKKVEKIEQAIEHLDSEIEKKMQEIESTKKKIKSIKNKIELAEEGIKKAEEDIKAEKDLYNQRMRVMYMKSAGGGYIDVILGAKDLNDLFSRVEAVKKITELDKQIVEELRQKQDAIEKQKDELTKEQKELAELNAQQEEKMDKLHKDKAKQDKLVNDARKQSNLYESKVKADQKQINETKKLIEEAKDKTPSYSSPSRGSSNSSSNSSSSGSADYSSYAVVAYASNYLGSPYVWGATGPNSFDCSGFVKYVYAHFGVRLPRVSGDQATVGSYVSRGNLQPGDLVFFGSPIHHVGMYVGNGCYIHAPRTGDVVKISSLGSRSDYTTARRVR